MRLHSSSYLWPSVVRTVVSLLIVLLLCAPLLAAESGDSTLFIDGFNAYQRGEYGAAAAKMSLVLKDYPTSPLRDMTLFWLARAQFHEGDRTEAARNMALFLKEYPDHPLKGTIEEELLGLAAQYDGGAVAATAPTPVAAAATPQVRSLTGEHPESAPPVSAPSSVVAKASATGAESSAQPEKQDAAPQKPAPAVGTMVAHAESVPQSGNVSSQPASPAPKAKSAETVEPASAPEQVSSQQGEALPTELSATPTTTPHTDSIVAAAAVPASEPAATAGGVPDTSRTSAAPLAEQVASATVAPSKVSHRGKKGRRSAARGTSDLRERAIADYRSTIERYPGTPAAAEAADRLRKMGVAIQPEGQTRPSVTPATASPQTVTMEVEQFADLEFTVTPPATRPEAGHRYAIPVAVVNNGNGPDSFSLEAGFPREFAPRFAASGSESLLAATPSLGPGETWRGVLQIDIPAGSVDGLKLRYPVRAVSRFSTVISRTSEVVLSVSAPLLRGMMVPDRVSVKPDGQIAYRVTVLNIGSTAVRDAELRLVYPPLLEPVSVSGFQKESGNLVLEHLALASGETREMTVTFRLARGTLARQELICRGELTNQALHTHSAFVSPPATVAAVSGVALSLNPERMVAIPGQTLTVPVSVANSGNVMEPVRLTAALPAGFTAKFYQDAQGKGQRVSNNEPVTGSIDLAPGETRHFLLSVATPAVSEDGAESIVTASVQQTSGGAAQASDTVTIVFSRPVVDLSLAGGGGRLKPGEIATVELTCVNHGTAVARSVSLQSRLPDQLELVATEPVVTTRGKELVWVIPELGAGEKRSFTIISRVRHGITAGSSLAVTGRVSYEDYQGNRY